MKKMKALKLINKFNILWFLIIVFALCLILSFFVRPKTYSQKTIEVKSLKGLVLDNDTTIIQNFKTDDNYSSIGFLASSNSNYINTGYINISIINDGKVKRKVKMSANEICDDNYYYKYYYVKYYFKKDQVYTLKITGSNLSDNILIGRTSYKSDELSLYKDDSLQKGNMAISFLQKNNDIFYIWYYLMIISLLIIYIMVLRMKGMDYEKRN